MGFTSWGPAAPLGLVAATPLAGFALQNATPTILSWTAPNDGRYHRIHAFGQLYVATAETGGATQVMTTMPDGQTWNPVMIAGGQGAGAHAFAQDQWIIGAGTEFSIVQTAPLTAGAAVAFIELWAS